MLKRITYFVLVGFMFSVSLLSFGSRQAQAQIDPQSQACEALGLASTGNSGDCDKAAGPDVNNTLRLGINIFSIIVGVAAVVMIIVGGFKYVISQGEGANTASAKNTILYAIIGLVVVVLAQVIVRFVLARTAQVQCTHPASLRADGSCS